MKECKICKITQDLAKFNIIRDKRTKKHYYQPFCKKCQYENYTKNQKIDRRPYVKKWREQQHGGTWKVYMLPNFDYYVGQTKAIKPRMYSHKQLGRDCTDYIILHVCDTLEDAIAYEKIYHQLGFPGSKRKKS
jgi:hypothetical protein